jgi:hypothetical protein
MAFSRLSLLEYLNRGARSAAELGLALGVSQPTVSRLLVPLLLERTVIRLGATRNARYARIRAMPELGASHWPIYRVDSQGQAALWATLHMLMADQFLVVLHADASSSKQSLALYDGLPYFLQDQRPAGFMGRNVPQRYPELQLPQRVVDWTDAHYLRYLTQHGWDAVSDLIVGDMALDQFLRNTAIATAAAERLPHYAYQDHLLMAKIPSLSPH